MTTHATMVTIPTTTPTTRVVLLPDVSGDVVAGVGGVGGGGVSQLVSDEEDALGRVVPALQQLLHRAMLQQVGPVHT